MQEVTALEQHQAELAELVVPVVMPQLVGRADLVLQGLTVMQARQDHLETSALLEVRVLLAIFQHLPDFLQRLHTLQPQV